MTIRPYGVNDVYMRNVGILKEYNKSFFKLVHMKALRIPGFEERGRTFKVKGSAGNTTKLDESLSRSRAKVFELAMANQWEYFVTLTVNAEEYNRYDLVKISAVFRKFINNENYRRLTPLKYLIVPEPHKDNAWHFHGLFMGFSRDDLILFNQSERLPRYIKNKLVKGDAIFNWPRYSEKFGWVIVEPIKNHNACSKYLVKYITKELQNSSISLNHHIYYCSKKLQRSKILFIGELQQNIEEPDFFNDYVRTKQFDNPTEAMQYFCDKEEDTYGTDNTDSKRGRGDSPHKPK